MEYENQDANVEAPEIDGPDMVALQKEWAQKIEKRLTVQKDYEDAVKRSLKLMRLDKDSRKDRGSKKSVMNVAWANYEVMRPTIYAQPPKPVVVPRFGGGPERAQLDVACQAIERATETMIERGDLHETMKFVRDELLKAGRGVAWPRYQPAIDEMTPERVVFDTVSWRDYLEGFAETWSKVPWVARRVTMTKPAFEKHFPNKAGECGVGFGDDQKDKKNDDGQGRADVWEIWCKESRKTLFMVLSASQMIECSEPLLNLEGFFPCPEPAMGSTEDGSRMPIPDVVFAEDQFRSIDQMTARIDALTDALRVRGFYSKGASSQDASKAIEQAVTSSDDRSILIPVASWAANGTSSLDVIWWPVDMIIKVVRELMSMRDQAIGLVYQVTGISDIMRGMSDPNETLGAQQLKAQSGSVRSREKIEEIKRFARDMIRIGCEIMCETFQDQTIAQMAMFGIDETAMRLIRDDKMRTVVVDVETDSTIVGDEQAEKANRAEFTQVIGGLIAQMMPVIQQAPELTAVAGEIIKFNAQAFRAGRTMERHIDTAIAAIMQKVQQAQSQPPKTDPKEIAAQSKAELDKGRLQLDTQIAIGDQEIAKGELQLKIDIAKAEYMTLMQEQQAMMAAPPMLSS